MLRVRIIVSIHSFIHLRAERLVFFCKERKKERKAVHVLKVPNHCMIEFVPLSFSKDFF